MLRKLPILILVIITLALPLFLFAIKQNLDNRSSAAAADKLEAEGGVLSQGANIKQDTSASGGSYVILGTSAIPTSNPTGSLPAFPGAQGGGAISKGGRGGAVLEVTNLNDSGTGSLRACIQASGPRTCIFKIGGTINLASALVISNPYITIAGQTAPGGGILLSGKNMNANVIQTHTHDVIIRYLKLRKGYSNCPDDAECGSTFQGFEGTYNTIVDHVSTSWNQDEGIGFWRGNANPNHSNTVSWSIMAEGLSTHPTGAITGGNGDYYTGMTNIDFHHNLLMNNSHRNPLMKHKSGRWINNIGYNHSYYSSQFGSGVQVDVIGNLYKKGPLNATKSFHEVQSFGSSIYMSGNKGWYQPDPSSNQWVMTRQIAGENQTESSSGNIEIPNSWRRTTPLASTTFPIVADDVNTLESKMLPKVGASQRLTCDGKWVLNRDSVDNRLISQYQNNTGISSIIENESNVGGFPNISGGTACTDSDKDGMPDVWETARGLNPNSGSDRNNIAPDGFTQLENYLNGV